MEKSDRYLGIKTFFLLDFCIRNLEFDLNLNEYDFRRPCQSEFFLRSASNLIMS